MTRQIPNRNKNFPTTVELMSNAIKDVCKKFYVSDQQLDKFSNSLLNLYLKNNHLFIKALTLRWMGKRRLFLIKEQIYRFSEAKKNPEWIKLGIELQKAEEKTEATGSVQLPI